jgi:Flp pilus assembly protein TadB
VIWAAVARYINMVPERVWRWAAVALAAVLLFQLGQCSGADRERARQAQIEAQAAKNARKRDEAAGAAVRREQDDVRESNQRARDAAAGSDDPLRSFLDSLRADKTRPDPPAP